MALIAHWPLNGNTDDISGNGYDGTPTDITYVAGKIGQAGSFNGTNSFVNIDNTANLNPLKTLSLSVWVYANEIPTGERNFIDKNGYFQYRIGFLSSGGGIHSTIQVTNGTTTTFINGYGGTYTMAVQTWTHLTYVVDLNEKTTALYVNGTLYNKLNITSITGDLSMIPSSDNLWLGRYKNGGTYFNGLLNDVRIYDHVLTDMEIQEIARAKILHYTFDDFQEPTTNLIGTVFDTTFETMNGISNYSSNISTDELRFNGHNIYKIQPDTDASGFSITSNIWLQEGDIVNLSFWVYIPSSQSMTRTWEIHRHMLPDGSCVGGNCHHYNSLDYTNKDWSNTSPKDVWFRRDITIQVALKDETYTVINGFYARIFAYSSSGIADGYFYITEPQIEKKSYPTEFTTGTRTGRVNDYSGFFNHSVDLTEANTPRWISDAKIGTGAYKFMNNGTTLRSYITLLSLYTPETITMLTWFKGTEVGHGTYHIPIGWKSTDFEISIDSGGDLRTGYKISGTRRIVDTNASLMDGNWHLIGSTYDGNYIRAYIDGIEVNSANYVGTLERGSYSLGIGQFVSNNNYGTNGYQDDVRIYATALSDNDILDLYQTRAEIEESGVLYSKSFISDVEPTFNLLSLYMDTTMLTNSGWSASATPNGDGSLTRTSVSNWATISAGTAGVISGVLSDGDIISYSGKFKVEYIPTNSTNISIAIRFVYEAGGSISYNYWTKPIGEIQIGEWYTFKNENITVPVGTYSLGLYLFFNGATTTDGIVTVKEFQLEYGDHSTPFIKDSRPIIPEIDETTFEYGALEIQETGIANFEDFSTVGITDGLVGYWPLNDLRDLSGSNNHLTNATAGYFNGDGFHFDGTGYLGLTNHMYLQPESSTLLFLLKVDTMANYDLFSYATEDAGSISQLEFRQTYIFGETYTNCNYGSSPNFPETINANEWFFYARTFKDNKAYHYLNGVYFGETSNYGTLNCDSNYPASELDNYMRITAFGTGGYSARLVGSMKNVKIFNRALTNEEIKIEYNTMFNNEVQITEDGVLYAKDLKQY